MDVIHSKGRPPTQTSEFLFGYLNLCIDSSNSIDKFIVVAGNAEEFDQNVDVNVCLEKLGLSALGDKLPHMECALMAHQVLGVAWMVDKEAQRTLRGGILGDDMGLGKVRLLAGTCRAVTDLFCPYRPSK